MAGTVSVTSSGSSGKRKGRANPKLYAVKAGKTPGIYSTWDEAKLQIDGVSEAIYQSFSTRTEAEAFMKGTGTHKAKPGKSKYYGVAAGHQTGVYTNWADVQAKIKGYKGAEQKSFPTRVEAQAYVDAKTRGKSAPIGVQGHLTISDTSSVTTLKMDRSGESASKRQKKDNTSPKLVRANGDIKYEPGMGPLPPDAEDGFDRTLKLGEDGQIRIKTEEELGATKRQATGDSRGTIVVSTDGASRGNGQLGARAGVGVYFGPADPRNVSEPLRGSKQTNQRAELVAIARALDHVPIDRDVEIRTDSMYSKKCLQEWFYNWEKKNWYNSAGKEVENKDLIQPIIARIRERERCRAKTKITWVKGHAIDEGNIAADALANGGSDTWTVKLASGNPLDMSETLRTEYTNEFLAHLHTTPSVIKTEQKPPAVEVGERDKGQEDEDFIGEDLIEPDNDWFTNTFEPDCAASHPNTGSALPSSIDAEQGARLAVEMAKEAASNLVDNGTPVPMIDDASTYPFVNAQHMYYLNNKATDDMFTNAIIKAYLVLLTVSMIASIITTFLVILPHAHRRSHAPIPAVETVTTGYSMTATEFSEPTNAAFTAMQNILVPNTHPSTSTTEIWYTGEPRPPRSYHHPAPSLWQQIHGIPQTEGLEIDSLDHTFCHPHSLEYLYYTIAYPNGTLARDLNGRHALFYAPSPWRITYFDHLAEAILNDTTTTTSPECTGAHCYNEVIPGVNYNGEDVILKQIQHPSTLRGAEWQNDKCEYSGPVRSHVSKSRVGLADIGYFIPGANLPPPVLAYMEKEIGRRFLWGKLYWRLCLLLVRFWGLGLYFFL
ncbi:RnhA Ribonuclease HI [Pyrenophora teres f. maculata]|nr:RnhA Ribonuclease HI [Pyrenophora teres f. maculata]